MKFFTRREKRHIPLPATLDPHELVPDLTDIMLRAHAIYAGRDVVILTGILRGKLARVDEVVATAVGTNVNLNLRLNIPGGDQLHQFFTPGVDCELLNDA